MIDILQQCTLFFFKLQLLSFQLRCKLWLYLLTFYYKLSTIVFELFLELTYTFFYFEEFLLGLFRKWYLVFNRCQELSFEIKVLQADLLQSSLNSNRFIFYDLFFRILRQNLPTDKLAQQDALQ